MKSTVLIVAVVAYLLLMFNVFAMLFGFAYAAAGSGGCGARLNITYVLPAYEVGCWLGSPK